MAIDLRFSLVFEGALADENLVDLYDASEAMSGFQRSLAITAHLILNGIVITQAPALKNARIYAGVPEEGSWKLTAILSLISVGAYHVLTAPKDTVLGNLVVSAYDYVLKESVGIHVDFNSTIGQQLEKVNAQDIQVHPPTQDRIDSVIEKCEASIKAIHRPFINSKTAEKAIIRYPSSFKDVKEQSFDEETFDYMNSSAQDKTPTDVIGKISSYNINTFKGRIFSPRDGRPIPFLLADFIRVRKYIALVTGSLNSNALDRGTDSGFVKFRAFRILAPNGRLKSLIVIDISSPSQSELADLSA